MLCLPHTPNAGHHMDLKTQPHNAFMWMHESIYSPYAFEFMQGGGHVCVYSKPMKLGHSGYNASEKNRLAKRK